MTDPIDELMTRLRGEYLADIPARMAELRDAADHWLRGGDGPTPLGTLFHRLSGSAGAYGFAKVSLACRGMERWLTTDPRRDAEAAARLDAVFADLEQWYGEGPTEPDIGR